MAPPSLQSPSPGTVKYLKNKDIIIVSFSDWEGPKRIRQFLSEELAAQGNRVLFVEAQYTLSKFVQKPSLGRALRFLKGPRQTGENLFLLSTFPFVPGGEFSSSISRMNWNLERTFLRRAVKSLGFHNPILWVFAYNASSLVGKMDEALSLYFCNDAFSLLVESKALQQRINLLEQQLMQKVDLVFTVSDKLTEEKSQFHRSVHTICHGVDHRIFQKSAEQAGSQRPADLPSKKPILGYSGVIRYMLDLDMLRYLADQRPEWSIVLVGPVTESRPDFYSGIEELKRRPNVHFLGMKAPEVLPSYIREFDVCLLPYVSNEISKYYAAPLKFYEYLAAGKPVVSTVGPLHHDVDIVFPCSTPAQALAATEKALAANSAESVAKRRRIAAENSWEQRVREIDKVISAAAGNAARSTKRV